MTTRDLPPRPKLYDALAPWWPLLSAPAEYAEEAALYRRILTAASERPPRTLLELGSGGGNNASHLKAWFELTLVEPAPGMLEVSRRLNPECEHIRGDMRTIRLGRAFDCVFIQDAIDYMTTAEDLARAVTTAFVHCRPGGIALFAPDHVREIFRPSTSHGGHDEPPDPAAPDRPGRGLRYLEWTWDPDPSDTTLTVDYAYLLREADRSVRVEHDRHIVGLFPRSLWLDTLAAAGFEPERVPFEHSELDPGTYEGFLGRRPGRG